MNGMKFKYYHGTRDIFLPSIREHGLGKINPNTDFKNLDVLRFLVDLAEKHLRSNAEYEKVRDTGLAMSQQTFLKMKDEHGQTHSFNYRHDSMYASFSRIRAAIYACFNRYGSEIVEKCILLIDLLNKNNVIFKIPEDINLFKVESFIGIEAKPIMIEINGLEDEFLEEETRALPNILSIVRHKWPTLPEKEQFEYGQFLNFKLLKPIEPSQLKFYEIDFEGHPSTNNFEFTLSKI